MLMQEKKGGGGGGKSIIADEFATPPRVSSRPSLQFLEALLLRKDA